MIVTICRRDNIADSEYCKHECRSTRSLNGEVKICGLGFGLAYHFSFFKAAATWSYVHILGLMKVFCRNISSNVISRKKAPALNLSCKGMFGHNDAKPCSHLLMLPKRRAPNKRTFRRGQSNSFLKHRTKGEIAAGHFHDSLIAYVKEAIFDVGT